MKKFIALALTIILLAVMIINQGCKRCDDPIEYVDTVGANFFDWNIYSDYYNFAVLSFIITQTRLDYGFDCGADQVTNELVIRNNTSRTISLDYNIVFVGNNSGRIVWSYQGVSTIPAGGFSHIGEISDGQVLLNAGTIYLESNNMVYQ
jgi:hypothetical protein